MLRKLAAHTFYPHIVPIVLNLMETHISISNCRSRNWIQKKSFFFYLNNLFLCVFYCVRTHIFFQCFLNESQGTYFCMVSSILASIEMLVYKHCNVVQVLGYIVLDEKCLTDISTKLVCDGLDLIVEIT